MTRHTAAIPKPVAVGLSKSTWTGLLSMIMGLATAAGGWANSMQIDLRSANANLSSAIAKVDALTEKLSSVTGQLKGIEKRLDRYEDRLQSMESGQPRRIRTKENADG